MNSMHCSEWVRLVSRVPWLPKGPNTTWGTSSTALPADCLTLHCTAEALSTGGSLGCLNARRTSRLLECSRGGVWPTLQKVSRTSSLRAAEGIGLFSLEKRGLRGVLITAYNSLKGEAEEEVLITLWWPENRTKLHWGKFRLDTRKRFFSERGVSHWCSDPGKWPRYLSGFEEHPDDTASHTV